MAPNSNKKFSIPLDGPSDSKLVKEKVDITFEDVSYSVRTGIFKRNLKNVLKDVSGHFRAGELTAIMGQSGAGKSTLMDILAGYTPATSGVIRTNGLVRDEKAFRKQLCYIMQDDIVQSLLTVAEAMRVSAKLKLGSYISDDLKETRVNELIRYLGLEEHKNTRTGSLSGGQRKRLAIGLELIPDPAVMFLDEPTSGLDSSTALQLVVLLRKFAQQGRTVIITCHQPGGRLLECIDTLYSVSAGRISYCGSLTNIVPYLSRVGIDCPPHHSPIDYMIEQCSDSKMVDRLVKCCDNGKCDSWHYGRQPSPKIYLSENFPALHYEDFHLTELPAIKAKTRCSRNSSYNTSQLSQFIVLFLRNIKILIRDHSSTWTRLLISLLVAILIGSLFYDIGTEASSAFSNFRFLCISCMFNMFTSFSSAIVKFPLELPTVRREHFNRWYSSGAYFCASVVAGLPIQVLSATVYTIPAYYLTGQPNEIGRILSFILFLTMVAIIGGSLGLLNGACFDVKNGIIGGSFFIAPWVIFSGIFLRKCDAPSILQWIFTISYMRHGMTGLCASLFLGRGKLRCEDGPPGEIYMCPFNDPQYLMKELDIPEEKLLWTFLVMICIFLIVNLSAFVIIKLRLKYKR